ncbi:hypothetical protein [Thermoflavimicrobium daqui]|uniref:Uncharacterized protein n=1 Tax=Thermoflavimicrobium daqui TaxID=2137476 RepID=A0A364K1B9_9BACL|nr:hypothetical protein [Thermoflavimicrobium daqui]RAL21481.1 hypothetical protein DL897_16120 [Thermoflavimicrobium daqui]
MKRFLISVGLSLLTGCIILTAVFVYGSIEEIINTGRTSFFELAALIILLVLLIYIIGYLLYGLGEGNTLMSFIQPGTFLEILFSCSFGIVYYSVNFIAKKLFLLLRENR